MIARILEKNIISQLKKTNKVVIIYGARQVGKTTLANKIIQELNLKTLKINADEQKYINILSSRDFQKLEGLVSGYELLFIDEAQRIPDIGINLKILVDRLPDLKILVTGSSSFDLANKVKEPLTGRTWTYTLYPIAYAELKSFSTPFELKIQLEERFVFGSYPEVFNLKNYRDKEKYLDEVTASYLYKDILELANLKQSSKMINLLQMLAFQIGSEVSLQELGTNLGMSKNTVAHYLDLLEKSFVVFRLKGFSRNLRKEIIKKDKIYFYDLGVRNSLINNFHFLSNRNDQGRLWENFLVTERKKYVSYGDHSVATYFWRTYTGAEIDYVEESGGKLSGFEFKFRPLKSKGKIPQVWKTTYKGTYKVIHQENFLDFICRLTKS